MSRIELELSKLELLKRLRDSEKKVVIWRSGIGSQTGVVELYETYQALDEEAIADIPDHTEI
jgi:hypothetical protein